MSSARMRWSSRSAVVAITVVAALTFGPPATAQCKPGTKGFVDGSALIDIFGDDAVAIEVTLGKALLGMAAGLDEDLARLAGGLECVYTLVLELDSEESFDRAGTELRAIEKRLMADDWQRIARVREGDEEVKVLVQFEGEEQIQGLVVLVVESGDGELVFVNIAGLIDLAALEELGDAFELPGLEEIKPDR